MSQMNKSDKSKMIIKAIISVLVIGVILGVFYLIMYLLGFTKLTREELQTFVQSKGAFAPLIFILISFLQVTFVPIPGAVTILAGNYVFGAGLSFLYSYIGMMLGAIVAFALGKLIGRPFVNWVVGSSEKTDEWLQKLKGREKVVLFFMFFLPLFPDDALCAVAGLLPIGWGCFIVMQVITRATSIGGTLLFMSGEVIPYHGWGLVVLVILGILSIVAFIISFKNAEKIDSWMNKFFDKFKKHD